MRKNEIRTIEMVRSIRDQIRQETEKLSAEEYRAFIAREAARLVQQPEQQQPRRPAA
jgi:hypothetical protein